MFFSYFSYNKYAQQVLEACLTILILPQEKMEYRYMLTVIVNNICCNFLFIWYFFMGPKHELKNFLKGYIFLNKIYQISNLQNKFLEFCSKDW